MEFEKAFLKFWQIFLQFEIMVYFGKFLSLNVGPSCKNENFYRIAANVV